MIIDVHIHLWNRLHDDDFGGDRKQLTWGRAMQNGKVYYACPPSFDDSLSTYPRALAHMDWLGIDRAVVVQEFMDGKQDDYLAEVRQACPKRFSCMALLTQNYFEDPMRAFKHAIEEQKLQGFLVKTPHPFPAISVPVLMPLWQTCAERGLPIVLKDGAPDDVRKLAKAVPSLKIVLSHFASGYNEPEHLQKLDIVAEFPNVYIDAGAITYMHRAPFPKAKENLRRAVNKVGAEKIAWGSDYPRPGLVADNSYKQQLEFITLECDFLTEAQRAQILSGTALKVYVWEE
jgi:L-galactono-1,5-lactonase